jgi:hypothetical protein
MASSNRYLVPAHLIAVLLLALLTLKPINSTLRSAHSISAAPAFVQPTPRPQANPHDEMIAQASLGADARDPFHWPAPDQSAVISQPVDSLRLCSMLVDQHETIVTISVNGDVSPGLAVGDQFKHWTVKSASDKSITVVKDGQSRTLAFYR